MLAWLNSLHSSALSGALMTLGLLIFAWLAWRQYRDRARRRYYRQRERERREYWGWD